MKALITGARGTVGSALAKQLEADEHTVVAWDRGRVAVTDPAAMAAFVADVAPDVVYHLAIASQPTGLPDEGWQINCQWPAELATITAERDIPLIFTSTAMVFSNDARGPFTLQSEPDAAEGYGYEKRKAEEMVRANNPSARIVRLGWQIGDAPGSNNMIDFLAQKTRELGEVPASTRWLPATSFLADTAVALCRLASRPPGLYAFESNRGWTFYDIACALSRRFDNRWKIVATDDFVYDQRQLDGGIDLPSLRQRLPDLPALDSDG